MKRISRLFGSVLLFAMLLVASCKEDTPEPKVPSKVHSIEIFTTTYSIEPNGVVEVLFRVEQPKALFNHIVSSSGCQVELRRTDAIGQKPTEVKLMRVVANESEGMYSATIADAGTLTTYNCSLYIVIRQSSGELVRSNPITIHSSDYVPGVMTIKLLRSDNPSLGGDVEFMLDSRSNTFSAHLDNYLYERTFVTTFELEGVERIEINGKAPVSGGTPIDFTKPATVRAFNGTNHTDYTLLLTCFTRLPVLHIETPGRQGVWSKDEWVEHSTLYLDGMGRFDDIQPTEMAIRGRGNSTWGYDKKPYAIKFTEKQKVMGMPKHKRWVLLANYMDRTLLRNRVAFYLASQTSLAWTPRSEFVELYLNGKHLGQYLLCEQVRVDNDRINITEMTPEDNAGDAITGGYLLELDFHADNMWQWWSSRGIPFGIKSPDEDEVTDAQLQWIRNHINEVESVLYGDNFEDPEIGYRKYIDAQSFVDYWLIYEICVNHELANPGSVFIYKDRGGKLVAGPVWDFDWGTFSYNASPAAQWGLFMQHAWWYDRLFDDPYFRQLASERWEVLKPRFETVFAFIDAEREYIEKSWEKNFDMWDIDTNINGDEWLSFDAAVDKLTDITHERMDIIDREL